MKITMANLFPYLSALLLLLNFSGIPKPGATKNIVAVTPAHSIEETNEFIPWTIERKLVWDDFYGAPQRNTEAVASTSTSLGLSYKVEDGVLSYQITCNFSKPKSWGALKTPYILAHEQGHFDITEIYARQLHKALSQYQMNRKTFKQDINNIYNNIVQLKEAAQEAYDGQSDHSRNRRLQHEWAEKIQQMLSDTEPWAVYP
jgi:hypothetical protein